ncbi:hypothetical protein JHK87_033709 [Glycine soja]|nr:hypothetical protein JHK87_033709 [Glycine soja]
MLEPKQLQVIIIKAGLHSHLPCSAKLIFFYALFPKGNLSYDHSLFQQTSMQNSFICNTMIRAFANSSYPLQALHTYIHMHTTNVVSGHFTYRPHKNVVSWNKLVGRYIRLGDIEGARVFQIMPERDVVSLNCMIVGCVFVKDYKGAMRLFFEMQNAKVS